MANPSAPKKEASRFDVTALGSVMLKLSTSHGATFANATSLRVDIAGAEVNVLIALARLGLRCGWFSRVPLGAVGRRVISAVQAHAVDTSGIVLADAGRAELLFVEQGVAPRPTVVHYDRTGAAIESLRMDDLDLDAMLDTRLIHTTAITPALSASCRHIAVELARRAASEGRIVSFDVNYREQLWPDPSEARETVIALARASRILFVTEREVRLLFGIEEGPESAARALREMVGAEVVVLKRGSKAAVCFDGKSITTAPEIDATVVDRLGAGDAFAAGVIFGYLQNSLELGLQYGAAMAALKLSTHGDPFTFDRNAVDDILESQGLDIIR